MNHVADRFVVLLDADVLFPFRKRDILLRFHHAGLFRARWTEQIISEWTLNLLKRKPGLEDSIRSQQSAMLEMFPEALVSGHGPLIESLELPDPDDRHVLAAAVTCGARQIATDNVGDFPPAILEPFGLEAVEADECLSRTFELYQSEALLVLKDLRSHYGNPHFTAAEFVMDPTAKGLPKLAAHLGPLRDFI
jgi:hypothetical protein